MGGPPAPYTQRMVRSGDWKLCYYHQHADGQPWQVIQITNPPHHHHRSSRILLPSLANLSADLTSNCCGQLFNLADDPDELNDRASDPDCADIISSLGARLLDGWDPEAITARTAEVGSWFSAAVCAASERLSYCRYHRPS